ncbi:MAG: hypothetical protein BAJALOKI2v1_440016 [Promethearchaeota archaeon]|nr:MAG: hypothetical protein BAJALOKI2v1_440016 [Candidatus Lokiarchaeota archaeon]
MTEENNSINITVKFFATFQKYGPKKAQIEVPKGTNVEAILKKYKIPYKDKNLIIIINGRPHQKLYTEINENDIVAIFPPLAGG